MKERLLDNYKKAFINYFNKQININKYDEIIKKENLLINQSNKFNSNINSIYYNLVNNFYVDKLNENDKNTIINSNNNDEITNLIKRTYINVLKDNNIDYTVYSNNKVKNGTLVLLFTYGKNNINLDDEEYLELSKKQREFIIKTNEELKKEINEKLNLKCEIFIEKRL